MRALIFTKPERVEQEFPPAHQFGMCTVAKQLGLLFKALPAAFDPFDKLCRRQRCGLSTSDPSHVPDEAAGSRFIDVVDLDTPTAMQLSGLPRAEAKIAHGDIAQWLVALFDELDRCLWISETADEA